jgi:CheY-like chemotaxis protein
MKNQQEIIKRTRRIGAFGQLAGGVAHDYNNMLGVILGYCELLRSEFASTPRALEYLAQIDVAGKQGCELTKRLLSYSVKAEKYSPRKPLKELLASSLAMLTRTLPKSIDIRVDVDIDSLDISVGEGEFIDIMVNLCLNACHAMNDSGILSITAEVIDVDQDKKDSLHLTKSKCVRIAVSDNGCGMSEQQKKHIFESFYTTKGEDGSGLGLSQVCQFMKAAGGNVEVITHPMIGTTFNLYFPQLTKSSLEPQANNTDQPAKIETNSGNKRTILLVDDQAQLMTLSREFFELHGYRVFAVTEGADAIKIASEHYVDLILTDVVMPKWNGYELFLLIKKVSPWTLAIFTSGLEDQAAEIIKPLSDAILINKPYSHVELISVVDSCFANEEHQPYERVNSKDAIFLRRVIAMNNRIEAGLYNHTNEYERVIAVVSNIVELEGDNQLELIANIDQLMLIIIDTESTLVDAMSGNNIALLQTERNRLLMELCYVTKYKSCQCTLVWLMQSFLYRLLEHYIASSKALAVKRSV